MKTFVPGAIVLKPPESLTLFTVKKSASSGCNAGDTLRITVLPSDCKVAEVTVMPLLKV